MHATRSPLLRLKLFTWSYVVVTAAVCVAKANWEFLFYIGVVVSLIALIGFLHKRIGFTRGVLWGLSLWGLIHLLGGLVPVPETWPIETQRYVLYNLWLLPYFKFDNFVHAYGFAIATWACYQALRSLLPATTPRWGILVLCVLSGMGLGAFNEMLEFAVTHFLKENNVGGYVNTGWDLVYNFVGGVLAAFVIHYGKPEFTDTQYVLAKLKKKRSDMRRRRLSL